MALTKTRLLKHGFPRSRKISPRFSSVSLKISSFVMIFSTFFCLSFEGHVVCVSSSSSLLSAWPLAAGLSQLAMLLSSSFLQQALFAELDRPVPLWSPWYENFFQKFHLNFALGDYRHKIFASLTKKSPQIRSAEPREQALANFSQWCTPPPPPRKNYENNSPRILAWPPLQSLAVEKKKNFFFFFCANFGRWKTFKIWWKMGGEKFLVGLRGLKIFQTRFGSFFRILFPIFQTVFRIDLKVFRGQFRSARVPPWQNIFM